MDQRGNHRQLCHAAPHGARAFRRNLAERPAGRRFVRRPSRRRVFWRVDVSSRDRRVEGRAGDARRPHAAEWLRPARRAVGHAAPRAVRSRRGAEACLSREARARAGAPVRFLEGGDSVVGLSVLMGSLLILLGVVGYYASNMVSPTALIPAAFGVVILMLGAYGREPS